MFIIININNHYNNEKESKLRHKKTIRIKRKYNIKEIFYFVGIVANII